MQLTGLHHLSAMTSDAPANHRFYTRVLGMRLVKKSVNQDDPSAYHLFYADGEASPGTDLTFFEYPMPPERRGTHSIARTGLRVSGRAALEFWVGRFEKAGVRAGSIVTGDGRLTLDFEDPEGQRLSLVDDSGLGPGVAWSDSPVDAASQIRGLGPITLSVPDIAPDRKGADRRSRNAVLARIRDRRPCRAGLRNGRARPGGRTSRRDRARSAAGPARRGRRPSRGVPDPGCRLRRLGPIG